MHPLITIFCPFTRRWAVDGWLENLAAVAHDPALTNLCIIVDCDETYIANTIKKFAEARGYRSFHVKINDDHHPNEVRLAYRRQRVAEIHNQSKDLINLTDGEIVIALEDDTVFDRLENFDRLINPLLDPTDNGAAFVEGVQVGRWGANMIGAWKIPEPQEYDSFIEISTLLPGQGYEEISGGGWYGYATKRELYLNCEYYTSSAQPWGPDVNYGLWLKGRACRSLIDWDTVFGHKDYNKVLYPDSDNIRLAKIVFTKNELTGKWDRTDHEQTRY